MLAMVFVMVVGGRVVVKVFEVVTTSSVDAMGARRVRTLLKPQWVNVKIDK